MLGSQLTFLRCYISLQGLLSLERVVKVREFGAKMNYKRKFHKDAGLVGTKALINSCEFLLVWNSRGIKKHRSPVLIMFLLHRDYSKSKQIAVSALVRYASSSRQEIETTADKIEVKPMYH